MSLQFMLGVLLEHSKCPFVWCHKIAFGLPTKLSQPEWPKHWALFAVSTVLRPQNSHRWWERRHLMVPTVYWETQTHTDTHPTSCPLAHVSQPKAQITVPNICVNRTARVAWWWSVQTVHWPQQSERCWGATTCGFNGSNYCGRLAVAITGGR